MSYTQSFSSIQGFARNVTLFASIAVIGILAARLLILIFTGPTAFVSAAENSTLNTIQSEAVLDTSILSRVTPFKSIDSQPEAQQIPVQTDDDIPETQLDVVLNGVRADNEKKGAAFISVGDNAQKRYFVGDEIEGLRGVEVNAILPDGVLLLRDGVLEKLSGHEGKGGIRSIVNSEQESETLIPDFRSTQSDVVTSEEADQAPEAQREPALATAFLERQEIESLLSWARFDPQTVDGVAGYTVFPVNAQVFRKSGLRARDVVQSINGVALTDDLDIEDLISALEESKTAEIALLRNQNPVRLTVTVTE